MKRLAKRPRRRGKRPMWLKGRVRTPYIPERPVSPRPLVVHLPPESRADMDRADPMEE